MMPARSRTLVVVLAVLLVGAAGAGPPRSGGAAPAAGPGADPLSWTPSAWPRRAPIPRAVEDARNDLREAREDARRQRTGVDAELTFAPELDLLWRDDPPRPVQEEAALLPEASLSWSPLRSETMLADARVLEAELRLLDAWRQALLARWRAPVERERAAAALRAAEADVREAEAERAAAAASVAELADDARREAERALEEAELDLRDARLDVAEARRDLAALTHAGDAPGAAERRASLALPTTPALLTTRRYRARALRLAADVARAERRRLAGVLPDVGVEAGYAGSDARIDGRLELSDGRPRARLRGALDGTPQERAWLKAYLTLRLGDDRGRTAAAVLAARRRERRALAELDAAWRAEARELRAEAEARRARWRLAEDRLAAAHAQDDAGRAGRAEDAARRAWLRYLDAVGKASTLLEALPGAP